MNMVMKSLSRDYPWLISVALHPGWVQTDMGGTRAPTSVEEAVQGLSKVIQSLGQADSGKFINSQGQTLPW